MLYPPLAIVVTTYNRKALACATVKALVENLRYAGSVIWHISDDGSESGHTDAIRAQLPEGSSVTVSNVRRNGVGASKNAGLREVFKVTPLVLLTEDDWELSRTWDITPHADVLLNEPDTGMIRLGWLLHGIDARLVELRGHNYWKLKPGSSRYVNSSQISLRHKRFYDKLGYHKEAINTGGEELDMCYRYNDTPNPPAILWPSDFPTPLASGVFKHIGGNGLSTYGGNW